MHEPYQVTADLERFSPIQRRGCDLLPPHSYRYCKFADWLHGHQYVDATMSLAQAPTERT